MSKIKIDLRQWVPFLVVLVALLGIVFIVADWDQIREAVVQARWQPIPYALLVTVISYTCISFSFAQVSKLMGVSMRQRDLAVVGFVSSVLNHIVMSGGAAGYTIRWMLMNRYGVSMREVVAISILHFYLTGLFMIAMLPFALVYLGLNAAISQAVTVLLAVSALILLLLAILATALIFWSRLRKRVIRFLVKAVDTLVHRDIGEPLGRFDATMDQGVQAMRENPASMAIIAGLIVTDWAFSAAALFFCFRAFDVTLSVGQLVSGFVAGTVAGQASLLPGGLGMQEASMSGIFALFGTPFEKAVLASVLYRVVFSIVPYVVSLAFYRLALRKEKNGQSPIKQEGEYENPYA
ncbi:MAG: flippase-like domain-containing protein [Anaerolineae bacterium]|nr:flippase-like domain-containing protein [Anaerolineae bacterium]